MMNHVRGDFHDNVPFDINGTLIIGSVCHFVYRCRINRDNVKVTKDIFFYHLTEIPD